MQQVYKLGNFEELMLGIYVEPNWLSRQPLIILNLICRMYSSCLKLTTAEIRLTSFPNGSCSHDEVVTPVPLFSQRAHKHDQEDHEPTLPGYSGATSPIWLDRRREIMMGGMDLQVLHQRSVAFSQSSPVMHERATEPRRVAHPPDLDGTLADSDFLRSSHLDQLLSATLTSLESLLFLSGPS